MNQIHSFIWIHVVIQFKNPFFNTCTCCYTLRPWQKSTYYPNLSYCYSSTPTPATVSTYLSVSLFQSAESFPKSYSSNVSSSSSPKTETAYSTLPPSNSHLYSFLSWKSLGLLTFYVPSLECSLCILSGLHLC